MKHLWIYKPLSVLVLLFMALPAFAAESVNSLQSSVSYALAHNRNLAVTTSQVDAADAQVDAATARLMPRLDVSTGFYRTNSPLNSFGTILQQQLISAADFDPAVLNNPSYVNNYMTRLGLSMPLYNGGATYAARSKASANAEAAELSLQFHKQRLIYQTITTYVQTRQALAQAEARKNAVQAAEQRLKDVKALKKRGMAINADVMDANVYVLRSQVALDDAQNQYENSVAALRLVLGMNNDASLGDLQEPNIQDVNQSLAELIDSALANRADLLALQQQEQAAEASVSQSQSGYLPHVNLTAAREWHSETFGLNNGNNSLGLTVSMNLFAGGGDSANVRAAESARISLSLQQEDKRQQITNEVNQAWRSLKTAEKKYQSEVQTHKQIKESLRIKALRQKQGLETTSDVLSAQVRADQAQVMLIRATYDAMIAKAALLLAAGTLNEEVVQ